MQSGDAQILYPTSDIRPFEFGFSAHVQKGESLYDMHYELELGLVLSGEMRRIWDGEERVLCPGQVWLNGTWETHGFELMTAPCRVAVFLLRPELLSTLHLSVRAPRWMLPFTVPQRERPQLNKADGRFFLQSSARLKRVEMSDEANRESAAFLLLLEILRTLCQGWTPRQGQPDAHLWNQIRPALSAVFATRRMMSEREGAMLCKMSSSTFRRKFSAVVGMPFGRFALNHRLKSAAMELLSERTIEEIAERWSFVDVSHFYRTFRQAFKQTPSQYRRQQLRK